MSHLGDDALIAYWAPGGAGAADGDAIEDHAFACDACAGRLAAIGAVVRAIPDAVRAGGVGTPATAGLVARMERDGVRLRHYRAAPGDRVPCTVAADDDLIVSWLTAELAGAPRVDLVIELPGRSPQLHRDVPIDRAHGLAIVTIPGAIARTWPDEEHLVRLIAVDDAGERSLGEYTFAHTGYRPA